MMSVVRLTDPWLRACRPPPAGRISVADGLCKGLHLRVTRQGTKTFSVMFRLDGRLKRKTLGEYPAWSLAAARKAALQIQREAGEGEGPVKKRAAIPGAAGDHNGPTYAELVRSYTDLHLVPNTRAGAKGAAVFRREVMQPFMARPASSIGKTEIVAVLDQLVRAGTPHAATNLLKSLRAMYSWAMDRDDMHANPCAGVRPPVRGNERDRVLTDAEIVAVLGACDRAPAPFGAMVRMLLHTGARRCEVSEARWREFQGNVWTLPAERSKSGRANVLPLPPALMAILESLPRYGSDDDFVFTTTAGRRPSSDFNKRKATLDALSGTGGWRLHDLRRTCRTIMSKIGVPRETARRVIGHSVDNLDARYDQHDHREAKAAALCRVAEHLQSLHR